MSDPVGPTTPGLNRTDCEMVQTSHFSDLGHGVPEL